MTDEGKVESGELTAPAAGAASETPIKVVLADSQPIYRVGIRKILAVEDDIRVLAQAENLPQALSAIARLAPDVILVEAAIGSRPTEAMAEIIQRAPKAKVIVLANGIDEQVTVELVRLGVRGIISRTISPDLLVKCVRKVAIGEMWLDNDGINWVLEAYRSQASMLTAPRPRARLNEKELRIIACVTQGMRNKDIAVEVGTTEQVVKNYLRKVYDKLGVSDRLELALYCLHHRLLEGVPQPAGVGSNGSAGVGAAPAAAPPVSSAAAAAKS